MADISDVELALVAQIISTLYPAGTSQASIIGSMCRIFRGWPNAGSLNADLAAGVVNVTVVPDNDPGRVTTRYLPEWSVSQSLPGTSVAASNDSLIVGGTPSAGDVIGALVDGSPFAYRVQAGDTPDQVAAALGALISQVRTARVAGASVAVPGASTVIARVVSDGAASFESRRQEKGLRVICWCPDPASRDAVAGAIDGRCVVTPFLPLADASLARLSYRDTAVYDQSQNASLYRRDLVYLAEYPSITRIMLPSMLLGDAELNGGPRYG